MKYKPIIYLNHIRISLLIRIILYHNFVSVSYLSINYLECFTLKSKGNFTLSESEPDSDFGNKYIIYKYNVTRYILFPLIVTEPLDYMSFFYLPFD